MDKFFNRTSSKKVRRIDIKNKYIEDCHRAIHMTIYNNVRNFDINVINLIVSYHESTDPFVLYKSSSYRNGSSHIIVMGNFVSLRIYDVTTHCGTMYESYVNIHPNIGIHKGDLAAMNEK